MPVIKRGPKRGDEPARPPMSRRESEDPEELEAALILDFYDEHVDWVRRVILEARDTEGRFVSFELDNYLPRSLWVRLIREGLLACLDDLVDLDFLDGFEIVTFAWTNGDDGRHVLSVYADEEYLGESDGTEFFEGWELAALRWLMGELGITASLVRGTLNRVMPKW